MYGEEDGASNKKKDKTDTSPDCTIVKVENSESPTKESDDPKPRIVLTFRSDKSGAKTSNMKIVSKEEKHEETPRRSSRTRNAKCESDDDSELVSPKKEKVVSESEETSDSSRTKHSTRRRGRESSDVIANAIARKEKYNEAASTSTRPTRRIKPTAKVLANEELRIGLESQNITRLDTSDKTVEEGVRTRRSAHRNVDQVEKNKRRVEESIGDESDNSEMKLKHLCELGLKSVEQKVDEESAEADNRETEGDNEECEDDDTEGASQVERPRRSRRLNSMPGGNESDRSSPIQVEDEPSMSTRRSSRRDRKRVYYYEEIPQMSAPKRQRTNSSSVEEGQWEHEEDNSNSAGAEEGPVAASPTGALAVFAVCQCEDTTNIYAAPSELTEPVFCQAIEIVDGMRVGCSHKAQREEDGGLSSMRRAGPRAPYLLLCKLHAAQMDKHMCCPACGLFCTQGIFNQCSKNHLFHLECGVPYSDARPAGCPHCGVHASPWRPVNRACARVQVNMTCSNKRVYLPDQREQCTPAYLSFSTIEESKLDSGPIIPEDLMPHLPDLERLCDSVKFDTQAAFTVYKLYEGIIAGETVEQLMPKIVTRDLLNTPISDIEGGTCVHAAAVSGRLTALCLLQYAGANLDAADAASRTPLMRAVLALLEKETPEEMAVEIKEDDIDIKKEDEEDVEVKREAEGEEIDDKAAIKEEPEKRDAKVKEEDILRAIRYLIAAGCDVNVQGPEGMTALHMAAQHGGGDVAALLLRGGAVADARDAGGWTPLVRAAENSHADVARLLLKHGADASATDNEGNGVIHWCVLAGDARSLQLLLDAASHIVDTTNSHCDTPLHIAAREGHYACVVVLLARGARTDIENASGELAAQVSAGECRGAIVLNMRMALATAGPSAKRRVLVHDISNGREPYPVPVINEVDDEPAPADFTYVSQHVYTEHVHIDRTVQSLQGCTCAEASCGAGCACGVLSVRAWYSPAGALLPAFPHHDAPMLFECAHTCACDQKRCTNRVVGRVERSGSLGARVQVFRTATRGWGLRARHRVPRGALVALYCGELLPAHTADARAMDHYMFALDVKPDLLEQCSDKTQLCVDAARYGSAARFVNHSCRPNTAPVRVFTATRDLRLPAVALFALRDLAPLQEITFDYGDKFWAVKSKWMKCECGMPECRYPTINTEESES
ncbi:histone-lysine N-methyltransferase EHMT1 isoform X2 [Zerene cesonia]|uniref:histone-lysine N-methyltransferase EHMT1 isoform X2 n=1 Tax=Zerene cesonia TaxID=33412 RepID=UPI0018E595E0|nr:histone-lysine N-methyltransferase EHMT1 isoform X2 [Zerene cesonia]